MKREGQSEYRAQKFTRLWYISATPLMLENGNKQMIISGWRFASEHENKIT